jgi:hypothetical protein
MTSPAPTAPFDVTAAPRAVLRESVKLLYRLLGERRLGTARANAWAAICDDRRRADERVAVSRALAAAVRRDDARTVAAEPDA